MTSFMSGCQYFILKYLSFSLFYGHHNLTADHKGALSMGKLEAEMAIHSALFSREVDPNNTPCMLCYTMKKVKGRAIRSITSSL